jgi:hypothetical protein
MQRFKGDATEEKMIFVASGRTQAASTQKTLFYNGAYECFPLGEMLFDSARSPLANAIPKSIFREAFPEIIDAFIVGGSFESYLTVFRRIFGETVNVVFTVPAPGKLQILIESDGVNEEEILAREIEDDEYIFYELIDDEGDNIVFQTVKGFQSQYELEQMLFELVPGGIYTEITLTVGGE